MDSLKPIERLDASKIGKSIKSLHSIIAHVSYNVPMLTMTYEYKLQPTAEQIATIEQTLLCCRSVWNFALRQRKDWCASRKSPVNACSIHSEYIIPVDELFPNYHKQAKQYLRCYASNLSRLGDRRAIAKSQISCLLQN